MEKLQPGLHAIIETSAGPMTCRLYPEHAPKTVENFVGLAQGTKEFTDPQTGKAVKRPFYDGLVFHRVMPNFMIQGGCPLSTGTGGPGYQFEDEFTKELRFDRVGLLAMANAGPGTPAPATRAAPFSTVLRPTAVPLPSVRSPRILVAIAHSLTPKMTKAAPAGAGAAHACINRSAGFPECRSFSGSARRSCPSARSIHGCSKVRVHRQDFRRTARDRICRSVPRRLHYTAYTAYCRRHTG